MSNGENSKSPGTLSILKNLMIQEVPSYANRIFYSLGFLSMTCFFILIVTGMIMVFFGPNWWLTSPMGIFTRSIHLWATQAFVLFILLHVLIVFLTSGYKPPRQLTWVLGALMLGFVLTEAEFGFVLRNDFSSQWRSLQGADFYNGSGLGRFINTLNYTQIYGIHIVIIPLLLVLLLFLHYLLVRTRGIAKPYKKDFKYKMVKANHTVLFVRGFVLVGAIVLLALVFPSPIIAPVTIREVAKEDSSLMAKTLISEFDHASDTATYFDNIDPYRFDTRKVYIEMPYLRYRDLLKGRNMLSVFNLEGKQKQNQDVRQARAYFSAKQGLSASGTLGNPVISVVSSLVLMAQSGLYESFLRSEPSGSTYALRFLSDTGVLEAKADRLKITTGQYGMLREEKGSLPPGAWWLAPLGFLDHTILKNDDNQDRDGAEILGLLLLVLIAFPFLPVLKDVPEKIGLYKFFWRD